MRKKISSALLTVLMFFLLPFFCVAADATKPPLVKTTHTIESARLANDPLLEYRNWLKNTHKEDNHKPFLNLATISDGQPLVRLVAFEKIASNGLVFTINPKSDLIKQFIKNPNVATSMVWSGNDEYRYQIRLNGTVVSTPNVKSPFSSVQFYNLKNQAKDRQRATYLIKPTYIQFSKIEINDSPTMHKHIFSEVTYTLVQNKWKKHETQTWVSSGTKIK